MGGKKQGTVVSGEVRSQRYGVSEEKAGSCTLELEPVSRLTGKERAILLHHCAYGWTDLHAHCLETRTRQWQERRSRGRQLPSHERGTLAARVAHRRSSYSLRRLC